MAGGIDIKWLGHSCYKISLGEASIVIDPYHEVRGYPPLKTCANMVLASHGHGDHNYVEAVEIIPCEGELPFTVRTVDTFHDNSGGTQRGSNLVHIIEGNGIKLVHLGDLGHALSSEQVTEIGFCDVLMLPVGGYYTIGPDEAAGVAAKLNPTVIIPMHYRDGERGHSVCGKLDDFLENYGESAIKRYDSDTIHVGETTPMQIAVLKFLG